MRKAIIEGVDLEKTLLRKVGEAIARYKMIREGDRVAVAVSAGFESHGALTPANFALGGAILSLLVLPTERSVRR